MPAMVGEDKMRDVLTGPASSSSVGNGSESSSSEYDSSDGENANCGSGHLRLPSSAPVHHVTFDTWAKLTKQAPNVESQEFPLFTTQQSRTSKAPVYHTWRIWIILVAIGAATGIVATLVEYGIEVAVEWRMSFNAWVVDNVGNSPQGLFVQYLSFSGTSMFLASVAGILVCFFAPLAAGSGIPEIKCYLNGMVLTRVVSSMTLVAKAAGIVFSVSAGLPVGKEGPMIHSGAVIGGLMSKVSIALRNTNKREQPLSLSSEKRDIIAAGATAGVAAAFGAPMGACLFAIEEGTSHMNPRILLKLFVTAASAALVSRVASMARVHTNASWGIMGTRVPVFLDRFESMDYALWEFPIFVLMGVFGGLVGALFCYCNKLLTLKRKGWMPAPEFDSRGHVIIQRRDVFRFLEVILVSFTISSYQFWATFWIDGERRTMEELNDTQKLFWATGTANLRSLLHSGTSKNFDVKVLALFFVTHMVTTCWTYGLGVPSGLFVPSLLGGAAFGRIVGQLMHPWSVANAGIYALIGATAMLSGAARITISLAMILMEVTGEAGFSLPIFVTVMVARWTGNFFGRGIYDLHIIELKNVPLLEHDPEDCMIRMTTGNVMAADLVSFAEVESAENVYEKLKSCTHNGFPVMRNGVMVGSISRDTLHYLFSKDLSHGAFDDEPKVLSFRSMHGVIARRRPALAEMASELRGRTLDMRPYLSKDFHVVNAKACLFSSYNIFRQLGLRHLWVTGEGDGRLCGVITRKNLILKEAEAATDGEHAQICCQRAISPVTLLEQRRGFGGLAGL